MAGSFHGKDGSITFANLTAGVDEWELDWDADEEDTTEFGDTNSQSVEGVENWTATITANAQDDLSPLTRGASGTLRLSTKSTIYWEGTARLKKIGVSTGVKAKPQIRYEFVGQAALALTYS